MSLSIMQRILELVSKKIDKIESNIQPKYIAENNSNCLSCGGNSFKVTRIHKTKSKHTRYLKCKDCGANNKQILNIVGFEPPPESEVFVKQFNKPKKTVFKIINNKVKHTDSMVHQYIDSKDSKNLFTETYKKLLIALVNKTTQRKYDNGDFNTIKGKTIPVFHRDTMVIKNSVFAELFLKKIMGDVKVPDSNGRDIKAITCGKAWHVQTLTEEIYSIYIEKLIVLYIEEVK